jgi:hypothetical protein
VNHDQERVLLRRIVVGGIGEPALDVEAFVGPLERLGLGGGLEAVVEVSDLLEVVGGAGEELGGDGVARFNEGENGILVVVGRRSTKPTVWSLSQLIQVGVPLMFGVTSVGSPLDAGTTQMSPPVEPWSDMRPPMNAICLPSGEKRGTAICRPWSAVEVVLGLKTTLGSASWARSV